MNTFIKSLKELTNYSTTENGAITHKHTESAVLDMFAMCGAYRNRKDEDCILVFQKALKENPILAMKCLFYLRDVRGGQGERRFFRACYRWLCKTADGADYESIVLRTMGFIPEFGRWDDLIYICEGTPFETNMVNLIQEQIKLDMDCKTPSLLAKWMPSENASSKETKRVANLLRCSLNMTHKEYRQMLSNLRSRINIVEKLMSENRWDEIEFDKIPSRAGLLYKNAFARREIIAQKYEKFAKNKNTKVNADVLYPHEIIKECHQNCKKEDKTKRAILQKYWENLPDYYNGRQENGIAIVDTSGSMYPFAIYAAVGLGAYIAERGKGPFKNHFITFSDKPSLVEFNGTDIYEKFYHASYSDWGMSTNIEAVFDLLLATAKKESVKKEDMPERLYIFSDMEFNYAFADFDSYYTEGVYGEIDTLFESIRKKWEAEGYDFPQVIFWNLNARHQNIPALGKKFSYVSGFSPVMIDTILSGKDGYDLMLEKLLSDRYSMIY